MVPVVGLYAECLLNCETKDVFNNIRNTFCVSMCMMERASELGGNEFRFHGNLVGCPTVH